MIDVSRRRFFGFMAAPAVIGIDKRMSMWMPKSLTIKPTKLIVAPENEFTTENLIYKATERYAVGFMSERFRQLVGLREIFEREGARILNEAFEDGSLLDGHDTVDRRLRSASDELRARPAEGELRRHAQPYARRPFGTAGR